MTLNQRYTPQDTDQKDVQFYFRTEGQPKSYVIDRSYNSLSFRPADLTPEQNQIYQNLKTIAGDLVLVGYELSDSFNSFRVVTTHPAIAQDEIKSLTIDDLFARLIAEEARQVDLQQQAIERKRQHEEEKAAARREREQEQRERQRRQAEEAARAVQQAATINWGPDNTAILDLESRLLTVAGLEVDHRWKHWVYEVLDINTQTLKRDMGSLYTGAYLESGTVRTANVFRLFIVASETGSNKHRATHYRLVSLKDGRLVRHDYEDSSNRAPGWALRALPHVKQLLASVVASTSAPHFETDDISDIRLLSVALTLLAENRRNNQQPIPDNLDRLLETLDKSREQHED